MNGLPELLTTPQVAEILGIHRTTVWARWKSGELKAAGTTANRNGTVPLFDRNYIELYAQSLKAS